jgi:hypothetical protein
VGQSSQTSGSIELKKGILLSLLLSATNPFNNAERKFVVIPRRRMLEEIPLWIKMCS